MPTTFLGLLIFVAFLTPGFMHAMQARVLSPQRSESPLMETAAIVSVSIVANSVVIALASVVRWLAPGHTPDVGALLAPKSSYFRDHLPYVSAWAMALLVAAWVIAIWLARLPRLRAIVTAKFSPVIRDASAWSETLNTTAGHYTHAGCELRNGSYVGGRVIWFSTDLEETGDRELCLGPPLTFRDADGEASELAAQRVVVAAREIHRMDVTYIDEESLDESAPSWWRKVWRSQERLATWPAE